MYSSIYTKQKSLKAYWTHFSILAFIFSKAAPASQSPQNHYQYFAKWPSISCSKHKKNSRFLRYIEINCSWYISILMCCWCLKYPLSKVMCFHFTVVISMFFALLNLKNFRKSLQVVNLMVVYFFNVYFHEMFIFHEKIQCY